MDTVTWRTSLLRNQQKKRSVISWLDQTTVGSSNTVKTEESKREIEVDGGAHKAQFKQTQRAWWRRL